LTQRFRRVAERLGGITKVVPRLGRSDRILGLQWSEGDLVYDGPRFGVAEVQLPEAGREAVGLAVVRALQQVPAHVLEWVLWREAVLRLLARRVRLVREAADLGLYGGLKYGISNPVQRQELQRIWEKVSPPQAYEFYSYQPTVGFALIDEVMDGAFLPEVIAWLNSLRGGSLQLLSSAGFTAALERWMMEVHCILNATQVRVLQQLAERPDLSQRGLAERVQLSPAAVNGALKNLARRHLLRLASQLNFPLLGLYHLVIDFHCPSEEGRRAIKAGLLEHPYGRPAREFGHHHLVAALLIPVSRLEQFQIWTDRLCQRLEVPRASIHLVTEVVSARCFDSYEANRGWSTDFWPLLLRFQSILEGAAEPRAGLLHSFPYSNQEVRTARLNPIRLQPEDFAYFERFDRSIAATDKPIPSTDGEARQLGLSLAEAQRYRRRIRWLEAQGVRSPPFQFGLLHVGLDAVLSIRLQSPEEMTRRIVHACQLLPFLTGSLFEDGGALLSLLLPNAAAVDVYDFLRRSFADHGVDASLSLQPAWRTYGIHVSAVGSRNYSFEKGAWTWTEAPA
jgi:hypothetical protein